MSRPERGLTVAGVSVSARLHDATVTFAAGELTVVIGENGAGKSTLLDVCAGLLRASPENGVTIDGTVVSGLPPVARARLIASVGQRDDVDDGDLTGLERIAHGLVPRRGARAALDDATAARCRVVAAELGVVDVLDRPLGAISAGQRRRVHVARALVDDEARAFVLDEPHTGVDLVHQTLVTAALRKRARAGAVVVASAHELAVAARADRVVGLRGGRVVIDAPRAEALTPASLERVYGVPGTSVQIDDDGTITVTFASGSVTLPNAPRA